MVIRKANLRLLFFTVLFGLWLPSLWAQADSVYFPETRYTQRLAWVGDASVLRYEVLVEKEAVPAVGEDEFQRVLQQFTEASYIEVSLPPGKYRYRVIAYDAFNRPARESQWMNFEIRAAIKPELTGFSPNFFLYDKNTEFALNLSGKNFIPGAEIYLRQLGSANAPIVPASVIFEQDGNGVRLHFNYDQLHPGFYVIFVKNPGGQEASKGELAIGYSELAASEIQPDGATAQSDAEGGTSGQPGSGKKVFDIQMAALWMPLLPMQGGMEQLFGVDNYIRTLYLSSAMVRCSLFLHKPTWIFQPGLELAASWYSLQETSYDNNAEVQVMAGAAYIVLQKWLVSDVVAFTLRGGLGMGYQTGIYTSNEGGRTDIISMNGSAPHADFGAAFLFAVNHFTFEFGCHYTHMLVKENASGYLRPSVGLGWQF